MIQLLYSPQAAMLEAGLRKLTKNLPEDRETIKVDLQEETLQSLVDLLYSGSLLSEHRLIIASDCAFLLKEKGVSYIKGEPKKGEAFYEYLEDPLDDVDLFLLATVEDLPKGGLFMDALSKGGARINPVKVFDKKEWLSFIPNYLKKRGSDIDAGAIELLYERTQGDYATFLNEAGKLLAYANGSTISYKDVEKLVSPPLDENAFHLYEAILAKDGEKAFSIYHDIALKSAVEVPTLHLLASQFRFLSQCLKLKGEGMNENSIASTLKASPFRVRMALGKGRDYGLVDVALIIEKIYKADLDILTGKKDAPTAFRIFLAQASAK